MFDTTFSLILLQPPTIFMSGTSWSGLYLKMCNRSVIQHLFSLLLSPCKLLAPILTLGKEFHRSTACMKNHSLWFCVVCLLPTSLKCSCNGWLNSQIPIRSLHATFSRWGILVYLSCTVVPVLSYCTPSITLDALPWVSSHSVIPCWNKGNTIVVFKTA